MQKNNILTKLLDKNIFKRFSNSPSQSDTIDGLTRHPCNNLENLHESSPQEYQDFNTPMLNSNASINRLEKENMMKIPQNKKITRGQEYMLNSNMVITACKKNKDDNIIHGNINNKEANESTKNNDMDTVKITTWPNRTSYRRLYVGSY